MNRAEARLEAATRAWRWLGAVSPTTPAEEALRSLGLLCCDAMAAATGLCGRAGPVAARLPAPARFVGMQREEMLAFCGAVARSTDRRRPISGKRHQWWSELFGGVAQSYLRLGDIQVAAALSRTAAQLGLAHPWLRDCEALLLDQQAPEGYFGLIARELMLVQAGPAPWRAHLDLTVEILWALAEAGALENGEQRSCDVGRRNGGRPRHAQDPEDTTNSGDV